MDMTFILATFFMVVMLALAITLVNLALYRVRDRFAPPVVDGVEEDAVQYTDAFETYWIWRGSHATGVPNIFLSDRIKPVAFAAWQAGRKDLAGGY